MEKQFPLRSPPGKLHITWNIGNRTETEAQRCFFLRKRGKNIKASKLKKLSLPDRAIRREIVSLWDPKGCFHSRLQTVFVKCFSTHKHTIQNLETTDKTQV